MILRPPQSYAAASSPVDLLLLQKRPRLVGVSQASLILDRCGVRCVGRVQYHRVWPFSTVCGIVVDRDIRCVNGRLRRKNWVALSRMFVVRVKEVRIMSRECMSCNLACHTLVISFSCNHVWCLVCAAKHSGMIECNMCKVPALLQPLTVTCGQGSCHMLTVEHRDTNPRFCARPGSQLPPKNMDSIPTNNKFCTSHRIAGDLLIRINSQLLVPPQPAMVRVQPRVVEAEMTATDSASGSGTANVTELLETLSLLRAECQALRARPAQAVEVDTTESAVDDVVNTVGRMYCCAIADRGNELLFSLKHRLEQRALTSMTIPGVRLPLSSASGAMTPAQRLIHDGVMAWGLAELPQRR